MLSPGQRKQVWPSFSSGNSVIVKFVQGLVKLVIVIEKRVGYSEKKNTYTPAYKLNTK